MSTYFIESQAAEEEPRSYEVERLADGTLRVVTPEGAELIVDAYNPEPGRLHLLQDGESVDLDVRDTDDTTVVQFRGHTSEIQVFNERQMRMRAAGVGMARDLGPDLECPMAGKVVALKCEVGDVVEAGQAIVVVEAMKMENDLKAHKDGKIAEVHVSVGQAVEIGDTLITIADD